MNLEVAQFGLAEYFIDEVDESLYLVDMAWLVSFDDQAVLTTCMVAVM